MMSRDDGRKTRRDKGTKKAPTDWQILAINLDRNDGLDRQIIDWIEEGQRNGRPVREMVRYLFQRVGGRTHEEIAIPRLSDGINEHLFNERIGDLEEMVRKLLRIAQQGGGVMVGQPAAVNDADQVWLTNLAKNFEEDE